MVDFHKDAIILSGKTGTELKSNILGKYYRKWWEITSGGKQKNYQYPVTIVEMNSATGEVYIEDTREIILGSSGHALDLQANDPNAKNLGIILVENNNDCFERLQKVLKRKWPKLSYSIYSPGIEDDVFLTPDSSHVDEILAKYRLGNSLFFFDPLLSVSWGKIEFVAKTRIKKYYEHGTEFLIFLFTSDFFLGRNEYGSLPENNDEKTWTENQFKTVKKLDELLGNTAWKQYLLNTKPIIEKQKIIVSLYKKKLQEWFRYVVPLPFIPKESQLYHIFFCSNFELGVKLTKDFYAEFTGNPKFTPDNKKTYEKFLRIHPEKGLLKRGRSSEWKILWKIIKDHEDGLCDVRCEDLLKIEASEKFLEDHLDWLESQGYLTEINQNTNAWKNPPKLYRLDWEHVEKTLSVKPPLELSPLKSGENTPESR